MSTSATTYWEAGRMDCLGRSILGQSVEVDIPTQTSQDHSYSGTYVAWIPGLMRWSAAAGYEWVGWGQWAWGVARGYVSPVTYSFFGTSPTQLTYQRWDNVASGYYYFVYNYGYWYPTANTGVTTAKAFSAWAYSPSTYACYVD